MSAKAALDDTVEWLREGGEVAVSCYSLPLHRVIIYMESELSVPTLIYE